MKNTLLVDLTKCTGCEACVDACSGRTTNQYSERRSKVHLRKDESRTVFIPLICEHCAQHPCVEACPVEAIRYNERNGIFKVVDAECTGCGACAEACPYQGIVMTSEKALKCDLCEGDPLCVKFCFPGAIRWVEVDIDTLLADLRLKSRKLKELRGEHEIWKS
jgi:carbon-monoxide dehydrogenase iron sulfur subunit